MRRLVQHTQQQQMNAAHPASRALIAFVTRFWMIWETRARSPSTSAGSAAVCSASWFQATSGAAAVPNYGHAV